MSTFGDFMADQAVLKDQEIRALREQRDELLKALKNLLVDSQYARANGYKSEFMLRKSEVAARDAIAKAANSR